MLFQVIGSDKRVKMCTDTIACIPAEEDLREIYKAGYRFKLKGADVSMVKLIQFIETSIKPVAQVNKKPRALF